jgi:hypothetical protein
MAQENTLYYEKYQTTYFRFFLLNSLAQKQSTKISKHLSLIFYLLQISQNQVFNPLNS